MHVQPGISCWLRAWVELRCCHSFNVNVSYIQKGRVTGGFFLFAYCQRLSLWLWFFKLNFH